MAGFPQPGQTGIKGNVASVTWIPTLGISAGRVEAYASIYGTPPAYEPNPNLFCFWQNDIVKPGDVTFDIAQSASGVFYAVNVVPA